MRLRRTFSRRNSSSRKFSVATPTSSAVMCDGLGSRWRAHSRRARSASWNSARAKNHVEKCRCRPWNSSALCGTTRIASANSLKVLLLRKGPVAPATLPSCCVGTDELEAEAEQAVAELLIEDGLAVAEPAEEGLPEALVEAEPVVVVVVVVVLVVVVVVVVEEETDETEEEMGVDTLRVSGLPGRELVNQANGPKPSERVRNLRRRANRFGSYL
mmetsp:Transcript_18166/g.46120  ORF Transcript_18166/g.46120 Transcript_18166/m.46120 type:complete len:215 (-) Transcript_18166:68-712(-)